jgi:hypothetical protein
MRHLSRCHKDGAVGMLATGDFMSWPQRRETSKAKQLLPAEVDFYLTYDWSLHPHLTVQETIYRLRGEIDKLELISNGWQLREVATNLFLLSCALLNALDEYLRGPTLRMPKQLGRQRCGRYAMFESEKIIGVFYRSHRKDVRLW